MVAAICMKISAWTPNDTPLNSPGVFRHLFCIHCFHHIRTRRTLRPQYRQFRRQVAQRVNFFPKWRHAERNVDGLSRVSATNVQVRCPIDSLYQGV